MLAVIPLVAISAVLAVVGLVRARANRRPVAPRIAVPETGQSRFPALTRIARTGEALPADPARCVARVAEQDAPGAAIELTGPDGTVLAELATSRVVMARGWSRGHLILSFGESRPIYGTSWPLGPNVAGWEIHLVDAGGRVVRCYGAPGSSLDSELARLHSRLQAAAALLRAS
jgi:hypothetical protein